MSSVNIKDIAKAAGVGVSTVSRVLNNQPDVKTETKEKVLQVIESLNYVPNNSARNLKRNKTNHIGVFVIGEYSSFFSEIIEALEKVISLNGYTMVLHFHHNHEKMLESAVQFSLEKKLVGLIFLGGTLLKKEEGFLNQLNIPTIFGSSVIEPGLDNQLFSSVTIDNYNAAYDGVKRLIDAGHNNIALITAGYGKDSVATARHQAYKTALLNHHLIYEESWISNGNYSMASGYEAMQSLLLHKEITAVFCIADLMAIGAMKAIHDAGLLIPENISVMGFDGIEVSKYMSPSLTTIEQPSKYMGNQIGQLMIQELQGDEEHHHMILDTRLRIGQSTK